MANAQQIESTRGQGGARPVRTAAVVIYATLALLVLTIPQSLPNWLRDMEDSPAQQVLLQAASGVQAASHAARLDVVYVWARSGFLALVGKEDQ